MRSVGYTLETAIADLVDNSIAAKAQNINIWYFNDGEEPFLAIVDDGVGMDRLTSIRAMQLAGVDSTKTRSVNDLGRFGLGLKTASLSQARSILVSTLSTSGFTSLRWDLDKIAESKEWSLEELSYQETLGSLPSKVVQNLPSQHFTCVLWRNLDKLVKVSGSAIRDIDRSMQDVSDYLALVFHRYLHPYPNDTDLEPIVIRINSVPVPQRDPFLTRNTRTQIQPEQRILGTEAILTGYTLPYQNKLTHEDKELLNLGEEKGRTLFDTQGFYIYRAHRLITWGSWYRLLPRKESSKLSRVRVDIPNSMDMEWTLDIKKSMATPPKAIRDAMRKYVKILAKPSRDVQKFRGRKTGNFPTARVWDIIADRDGIFRYEVNEQNPLISYFVDSLDSREQKLFTQVLEVLSKAMPLEDIQSRFANDEQSSEGNIDSESLRMIAKVFWSATNDSPEQFVDHFKTIEPFSLNSDGEEILMGVTHD
jgi:hypothetical protein